MEGASLDLYKTERDIKISYGVVHRDTEMLSRMKMNNFKMLLMSFIPSAVF